MNACSLMKLNVVNGGSQRLVSSGSREPERTVWWRFRRSKLWACTVQTRSLHGEHEVDLDDLFVPLSTPYNHSSIIMILHQLDVIGLAGTRSPKRGPLIYTSHQNSKGKTWDHVLYLHLDPCMCLVPDSVIGHPISGCGSPHTWPGHCQPGSHQKVVYM